VLTAESIHTWDGYVCIAVTPITDMLRRAVKLTAGNSGSTNSGFTM